MAVLAVFLFIFFNLLEDADARERHRLIVPQHIKTIHRTHKTQYARAYGYETQLKHLKAVAPLVHGHTHNHLKPGIKSRVGPPPTSPSQRPRRPLRPVVKKVRPRGQASGVQPIRSDPQLYKRPGPAPGLTFRRPLNGKKLLPPPKLHQHYQNLDSSEQNAPNYQDHPSKYQGYLFDSHENEGGKTGGGHSTSYQIIHSNIGTSSKPKNTRQNNRIPYVDETNEEEAVDDYDEPETARLSASQTRTYRKPPTVSLKEVNSYGIETDSHKYQPQKEVRYSPAQRPRQQSLQQQQQQSSEEDRPHVQKVSPSLEAYKTAYQAFSYRKNRINAENSQSPQALRGEYSGYNSYGDPVNFSSNLGSSRYSGNIGNNGNTGSIPVNYQPQPQPQPRPQLLQQSQQQQQQPGDHDIGYGEGLV